MTRDELNRVEERLVTLAEYYEKTLTAAQLEIYSRGLVDLECEPLLTAMNEAVRIKTWMPKVSELREMVLGSPEDAAESSWGELLREIAHEGGEFGRPQLPDASWRAIQQLWGSWYRLRTTLPADGPELLGWKKQWNATYQASARTERRLESARDPDELGPSRDDARAILARIQAGRT